MKPWFTKHPVLPLGTTGPWWRRRLVTLPLSAAKTHIHVIGVSGSGKSRFLARLYLSLVSRGLPATLIDPHGDLAKLVLGQLVTAGVYRRPDALERVVYLDLPGAERAGRFLPLNVLAQTGSPHTVASNVKEAFHRAWPALAGGAAPMFDTLVQDGVKVLISGGLPITSLYRLLTDKPWRDGLLQQEPDRDIVAFFRDQFERLSPRDQADQAGAALRRAHLLTFSPVLRYSLGQRQLALDFREVFDQNRSLIINLALADAEARRLLGCLLTVTAEHAALSRAELAAGERFGSHHLIIDEFSDFTAQSEDALARMLSQTRKFGLFVVMAHQTWSQASSRLRGGLQNVGVEVVFRLGREDAEHSAITLGRVNPLAVKHTAKDEAAQERGHPLFFSLPEQWERWVQAIQDLQPRRAFVKAAGIPARQLTTLAMPDPVVDAGQLAAVQAQYLATYFRAAADIDQELAAVSKPATPVTRTRRSVLLSDQAA